MSLTWSTLCVFALSLVMVSGNKMVEVKGEMGLEATFKLETATIEICRTIPSPPSKEINATTPKANETKTAILEYALKNIQQWDDGKAMAKMNVGKCEMVAGELNATMKMCKMVMCYFDADVAIKITLCPVSHTKDKSFLFVKMHFPSYSWCKHDNETMCPKSDLVVVGNLKSHGEGDIKKVDKEMKMKGMNPEVDLDVLAFQTGSNTSHTFVYEKYHENNSTGDLKTTLAMTKKMGTLDLKIKHIVADQNSSIQLHLGLDPGYQKVSMKVVSLASVAKATILNIVVVMLIGIWSR